MCVRWGYWHGSRIEGLLRQQNNFGQNIAINLVNVRLRYGIYISDNFCWLTLHHIRIRVSPGGVILL